MSATPQSIPTRHQPDGTTQRGAWHQEGRHRQPLPHGLQGLLHPQVESLRQGFADPDPAARPMMRWWWFGPDVAREDLIYDLDQIAAAGLGGVECAFVYPMGATSDDFLSPTFLADLQFAAEAAAERDLRFDITLGSGWPYGGPHITADTASKRIHWEREEVPMAAQRLTLPTLWPGDRHIAAYIGEGTRGETPKSFQRLPLITDHEGKAHIEIPAGRGPRVMLLATSRLSGQSLKRASAGAEGLALDHLSADATRAHLHAVAEPLVEAAGPERLGTVFCDSLEVYDSGWTPALPEEFTARRGYDPLDHLWKLTCTDQTGHQFRADYYRTLTELVEENFIGICGDWAASQGLDFRLQCYGQPPVSVSSYRHAGAFEGEGWGWNAVTACRWASSAAQIWNRQIVSSETWTWNHSPSFRSTPLDILGEAHDHLLMGINHFIGHGWPTSPRSDHELGRVFYASGALDDRNVWWDIAAWPLWRSLHRLAWLMQQGRRCSDVAIYVPARDIYANFSQAGRIDLFKEARLHIGDQLPHQLRTAGLDYDLIDDDAVAGAEPAVTPERFPLVVLPYTSDIPSATRRWLHQVVDAGGTVLCLDEQGDISAGSGLGEQFTDAHQLATRAVHQAHQGLGLQTFDSDGTPCPNEQVAVTTREVNAVESESAVLIHFLANTGAETRCVEVDFPETPGGDMGTQRWTVIEQWDAETAALVNRQGGRSATLQLAGYEAAVFVQYGVVGHSTEHGSVEWGLAEQEKQPPRSLASASTSSVEGAEWLDLTDWTVQFPQDTMPRWVSLPHQWEQEPGREHYSGTATYRTRIRLPEGTDAARFHLDMGAAVPHQLEDPEAAGLAEASFSAEVRPPIGVVAHVRVDSADVGVLWKTPFRLDLTEHLTPGVTHELELVIANVTSHRLATDEGIPRRVAEAQEHYGQRFGIQTLELALADVASGLLAVPRLRMDSAGSESLSSRPARDEV